MKEKFSSMMQVPTKKPVILDEELFETSGGCSQTCSSTCDSSCSVSCAKTDGVSDTAN